MNIGEYFIVAGTIISLFFKSAPFQQIAAFLTQLGTALEANQGTVGPITIGNDTLTVTIAPKA
jgi:hypothetical protein